jgi:hypothetical protein
MLRKATTMSDIFADLDLIAADVGKCPLTILRWIGQPDGMQGAPPTHQNVLGVPEAEAHEHSHVSAGGGA